MPLILGSSSWPCYTVMNYYPRPKSEVGEKSKRICAQVKRPNPEMIEKIVDRMISDGQHKQLFGDEAILIPVPRSTPILKDGSWPSLSIAEKLRVRGLGGAVEPILVRASAVSPSHLATSASERTSVNEHRASLTISGLLTPPSKVILVDDVVTQGRTMCACALELAGKYPNAQIVMFALLRSASFDNGEEKLLAYCTGDVSFNHGTGLSRFNLSPFEGM
jgi:hypothetical protein